MTATISSKEKNKLPDWAVSTANQIEDLGFTDWSFNWDQPVPAEEVRIQVRNEKNVGQAGEVLVYAEAMRRGDKFPPVVYTRDGTRIDGNTRLRAAQKLGWPTFPAFVINQDIKDADEFTQERFFALGGAFNSGGPKPLSRAEMTSLVKRLARNPEHWTTDKVAQHLHIKRGTVQAVFAEIRAEQRAAALGVKLNGAVCPSAKTQLGGKSEKLSDDVFREVAQLTQAAALSTSDLSDLLKRVTTVTSGDVERLNLVATEREIRKPQIEGFAAGGRKKPLPAAGIRKAAERIAEFRADDAQALVDGNPSTRDGYLDVLVKAESVLSRLIEAQRQINGQE